MRPLIRNVMFMTTLLMTACAHDGDATRHSIDHQAPRNQEAMTHGPHVVSVDSARNFANTLAAAQNAIDKRGFKIFSVIDHAAGAESIDERLAPTTLIIFGNPNGGTPLMQAEQMMGLQLPLKVLITESSDGAVRITYADMAHTFHEYGIADLSGPLAKIESAMAAIAAEAGGH